MMLSHLCLPCMYKLHYLLQLWSSFCIQFLDSRTGAKLVNTASLGEALSLFFSCSGRSISYLGQRVSLTATYKYGQKEWLWTLEAFYQSDELKNPQVTNLSVSRLDIFKPRIVNPGQFRTLAMFPQQLRLNCDLESSFDIVDCRF